jgi:hypothetical protein
MFNLGTLPEMISRGELITDYLRNSHLRHPEQRGEIPCTRAQTIRHLDRRGNWLVETCHYQRPDGSIGASGLLDPKRINEGDTILMVKPDDEAMMTP